jgi:hypothetical protein
MITISELDDDPFCRYVWSNFCDVTECQIFFTFFGLTQQCKTDLCCEPSFTRGILYSAAKTVRALRSRVPVPSDKQQSMRPSVPLLLTWSVLRSLFLFTPTRDIVTGRGIVLSKLLTQQNYIRSCMFVPCFVQRLSIECNCYKQQFV